MRRILAVIIGCGIGLACTGCSKTSTTEAKTTDRDLEHAISARLTADPDLQVLKVSADASKNEATLSGTVTSEEQRTRAVGLAKSTIPGLVVTDKIDVKPKEISRSEYTEDMAREARERGKEAGDKIGKSIDDAWIHTKITTKLLAETGATGLKINVDVLDNVVTLRGQVNSPTAKEKAGEIARNTEGVTRVVNQLRVKET